MEIIPEIASSFIHIVRENEEAVFLKALEDICRTTDMDGAVVYLYAEDSRQGNRVYQWWKNTKKSFSPDFEELSQSETPWWRDRLQEKKPFLVSDVTLLGKEADWEKEMFHTMNIRSLVATPIFHNQALYGFMGFSSETVSGGTLHKHLSCLSLLGEILGRSLHLLKRDARAKLRTKTDDRIQQALQSISNSVAVTASLEAVVDAIQKEVYQLLDCSDFFLAFYDEKTDMLSTLNLEDEAENIPTWPAAKSLTGIVVKRGKPLLTDRNSFQSMQEKGEVELIGIRTSAWLGVPVFHNNKVIGALVVQSTDNPEAFDRSSIHLMEFIASQVGISIQRQKDIEELIIARKKAEESDHLKTAFINNLSHEIRTPLNAIVGFSSLICNPNMDASKVEAYMGTVQSSSDKLLQIIDDLLNVSRLEGGQQEAFLRPVQLPDLLHSVMEAFQGRISRKKITMQHYFQLPEAAQRINTDEAMLRTILTHLLDNAIKYTHLGQVELECFLEEDVVHFKVSDTGPGIPTHQQSGIFERFHQIEPGNTRVKDGLGLGLPICKAFVELLGGRIWLESEAGVGSAFHFTLPAQ